MAAVRIPGAKVAGRATTIDGETVYVPAGASDPGEDLIPVTPSDSTDLTSPARAIRCRGDGAAGTIRFVTTSGQLRNSYIAAGETLPVGASRIHATGTTATNLEIYV